MDCGACNKRCAGSDVISCPKCSTEYHILCLNMSREEQRLLRTKKQFVCPNCKLKNKTPKSDNTPVRQKQVETPLEKELDGNEFLSAANNLAKLEVSTEATSALTAAIKQLCDTFTSMKNEMSEFTRSLNLFSEELSTFRQDLAAIKNHQKETDKYRAEVVSLREEVAELRQMISAKDQRDLLKNIEISGLTESNAENLQQMVHVISTKLGVELDPRDVDDVRRVGPRRAGEQGEQRPRPVVLTLSRRAPRDQLLKAARVRRGLTTDMISIAGPSQRIYLNEHLSKANRILFSKARKLGSELRFKHTWTSNGNIFMRRSETSSVLQVTSEAILDKLSRQSRPSENPQNQENCS